MSDFLLELRSEEIPARMQVKAKEDLARLFSGALAKAGLAAASVETFATPRRLALIAMGLPLATEAVSEETKGPKVGAPPQAMEGFLRKTGLTQDQLTERDGVYFAVVEKAGRQTADVLAEAIPAIIRAFPWPKSQRWGAASISTESLRWVRPLQGIDIHCPGGVEGDPERLLDPLLPLPVAGFLALGKLEGDGEGALLSEERGLHLSIQGQGTHDLGHGHRQDDIDEREHAEEIEPGGRLVHRWGKEFTDPGAFRGHVHQGLRLVVARKTRESHRHHLSELVFADEQEGASDGCDRRDQGVARGVDQTKQTIAKRWVRHDEPFDLGDVRWSAREGSEELEIDDVILGDDTGRDDGRPGEEITLKKLAPFRLGDLNVSLGLHLFGEEAHTRRGWHRVDPASGGWVRGEEIDLDEVCKFEQRELRLRRFKVVEREAVSPFLEILASFDQLGVGIDVFEDFEHRGGWRKQGHDTADQSVPGAVHEGGFPGSPWQKHETVIDDVARGMFGVAREDVGRAGTKEQFMPEELSTRVQDGLPAQKPRWEGGIQGGCCRVRFGIIHLGKPALNGLSEGSRAT